MPHYAKFKEELRPGQTIFIKGFLKGVNFDIGLYCGKRVAGPERDDIAMLLAGRLEEGGTSLYSLVDGAWGKEEKIKLGIRYKDHFSLRIRTREDCFEVWANGRQIIDYEYTVPLSLVQYIYIVGEIDLFRCDWEGRYYPDPFCCRLPEGALAPGKTLYVAGFVLPKAVRLYVDIKSKTEFALHLDAQVKRKQLSRTSTVDGEWASDVETDMENSKFPLQRGMTFEVMVDVDQEQFHIYVNGQFMCTFAHRYPIELIDNLVLEGDVDIHAVSWS